MRLLTQYYIQITKSACLKAKPDLWRRLMQNLILKQVCLLCHNIFIIKELSCC